MGGKREHEQLGFVANLCDRNDGCGNKQGFHDQLPRPYAPEVGLDSVSIRECRTRYGTDANAPLGRQRR
jgi:hypothetical protein